MTIKLHYTHPKPGDENMSSATLVQNVSRSLVYLGATVRSYECGSDVTVWFVTRASILQVTHLFVSSMIQDELHFFVNGAIHLCFSFWNVPGDGLNEHTLLGQIIFDQDLKTVALRNVSYASFVCFPFIEMRLRHC